MAFKNITGSSDTFFNVTSTIGPPGLMGASGPMTDTISIGSSVVVIDGGGRVGVELGVGGIEHPDAVKSARMAIVNMNNAVIFRI